nr:hypothetical protein [Mycoplasmopsis bovis]
MNDSYFGSIGSKYYDFDVKIKIYPKDIKELMRSFKILAKAIIYYTYKNNIHINTKLYNYKAKKSNKNKATITQ